MVEGVPDMGCFLRWSKSTPRWDVLLDPGRRSCASCA